MELSENQQASEFYWTHVLWTGSQKSGSGVKDGVCNHFHATRDEAEDCAYAYFMTTPSPKKRKVIRLRLSEAEKVHVGKYAKITYMAGAKHSHTVILPDEEVQRKAEMAIRHGLRVEVEAIEEA